MKNDNRQLSKAQEKKKKKDQWQSLGAIFISTSNLTVASQPKSYFAKMGNKKLKSFFFYTSKQRHARYRCTAHASEAFGDI